MLTGHFHTAAASTFAGRPLLIAPGVVSTLRLPWEGEGPLVDLRQPPGVAFHVYDDAGSADHPLPRGGLSVHGISVLGFLVAVAPITTTPGTSLTLVVSRVAAGGRRQGWWVILGTVTGLYVHATLAAVGLAALVLRSSQAFWIVKLVGAGYLVGLGLWLLWSATRHRHPPAPAAGRPGLGGCRGEGTTRTSRGCSATCSIPRPPPSI